MQIVYNTNISGGKRFGLAKKKIYSFRGEPTWVFNLLKGGTFVTQATTNSFSTTKVTFFPIQIGSLHLPRVHQISAQTEPTAESHGPKAVNGDLSQVSLFIISCASVRRRGSGAHFIYAGICLGPPQNVEERTSSGMHAHPVGIWVNLQVIKNKDVCRWNWRSALKNHYR